MPEEYILPHQLYFDACYNPLRTQFLKNAEAKGCKILNGLGMSLYQGAAQIELWTGEKAPVEAMRQELLDIINTILNSSHVIPVILEAILYSALECRKLINFKK